MRNAHGSPAIPSLVGSLAETYRDATFASFSRPARQRGDARASRSQPFIARASLALAGLLVAGCLGARAADPGVHRVHLRRHARVLGQHRPDGHRPRTRWQRVDGARRLGAGRIAKVTPAGVVTEFTGGVTPGFSASGFPTGSRGPDGNVWFTEFAGGGSADHARGSGDRVSALTGEPQPDGDHRPDPTAICGSRSSRTRGGS